MNWMTLKTGDKIIESSLGLAIESTVVTDPKEEDGQVSFSAVAEGGDIINYMMTKKYAHYAPKIRLINATR